MVEASVLEVVYNKGVIRNFGKINRKTPVPETLFNKVASLGPATLLKNVSGTVVFLWICKISKNTFSYRTLAMAASFNGEKVRARKRYNFIFKQAVIKHAEEKSNREATRKYSVDEIAVSIWGWLQLTVFHLNFGFCLRVAYIRENTVFLNVFLGYITEHCFFLIKVGTEERFCGRKLFLERVYIEVIQRKPLQYSNRSAITNLFLMIISLGRCSLTSVYFSDF